MTSVPKLLVLLYILGPEIDVAACFLALALAVQSTGT